ncbi:MAG: hypothetical protein A3B68_08605 [Candidatus Melainabacteria bacterium RIFCSPHIGHO2_02_FULL_34_12]|nr:MAG: hypothetical protein A3B68_08605 [Candidatus Melainabacteria bacterium RIFCSPHIGHO2_02_FULL_34_12]
MFYEFILRKLSESKIKYLVIGGVAVNLHGYTRATNDLDIMLSFDKENVEKFSKLVKELGFKPKIPVDIIELADPNKREHWKKERNMKVFSIYNAENEFEVIDIMIQDYIDFETAYKNKKIMLDEGISIPVISISDLIKLKEIATQERDRDLTDLKILRKFKEQEDEGQR